MVAMHAASWLVQGYRDTPVAHVFLQGGHGGSVMEIVAYNQPITILHCVTGPQGLNSMG